jgi:P27 family predicted phage terminase small subunit
MGSRGPARTPTVRLALVGSHRAKSREKKEPKPRQIKPPTTIRLTDKERRVFNKTYDLLKSMSLHAQTDGNALARYAKNVILYNDASAFVAKNGHTHAITAIVQGKPKTVGAKRFAESRMLNELDATLLRIEREFGLTPSARASLQVDQPSAEGFGSRFIG